MSGAAAYRAHLATGSTTRARCWALTRRDGALLGFTDHDRPLAFAGFTFEPSSAVAPSEAQSQLGLAADDQDIMGALSSDVIAEADIRRGLYDGAAVAVYDVDWSDVSAHVLVARFTIGEIERTDSTWRAELRGRSAALNKRVGRTFLNACDAELGDARCGVDVTGPPFLRVASVEAVGADLIAAAEIGDAPDGFFDGGRLTWTSGANVGLVATVRQHLSGASAATLRLWRAQAFEVEAGDAFELRAGCDKSWSTCHLKFANAERFRGFPHIPSESFPITYARAGKAGQDGGTSNAPPS